MMANSRKHTINGGGYNTDDLLRDTSEESDSGFDHYEI